MRPTRGTRPSGITWLLLALATLGATAGLTAPASAAERTGCHRNAPPIIRDGFPMPQLRYSHNGRLKTSMHAKVGPARIDGEKVIAQTYDGLFPGPMLMICAGDELTVNFKNGLPGETNFHTHGFHVSPRANHDNVYLNLRPGKKFTYKYKIPHTNSPGAYWYHPHWHPDVEPQIFAGMAGGIVQEGGLDRLPALRNVRQRFMVIQNTQIKDGKIVPADKSSGKDQRLYVNGQRNPTAKIRPGEIQRWRIFNANADRIIVLRLAGQPFRVLAQDANTLAKPRIVRKLEIAPGSRREVLVRGGRAGKYELRAVPFRQFAGANDPAKGGWIPNQKVVTVKSGGRPVSGNRYPKRLIPPVEDLRGKKVDRRRTIVFSEKQVSSTQTDFLLNGHMFNPDRVITMKMDSLEQWKLVNDTSEWHTFHIHINEFQVISVAGDERAFVDYEDNVLIPPGSEVIIRTRPTQFSGKFVFHCHVTFHEDNGMMAAVQVKRNPTASELAASVDTDGALTVASNALGSEAEPALTAPPAAADAFGSGSGGLPDLGHGSKLYCPLGTRKS
ncbi:MAG TPA: multicopper oxidase family protein [Solirubrobacterales bacterium]|nr:multicopper oxidase family protein [Solirubrobacterales bacterium]